MRPKLASYCMERCPSWTISDAQACSLQEQEDLAITPGPVGIPNKLIEHLTIELHLAIHTLFVLMWMMGTTPQSWKESDCCTRREANFETGLEQLQTQLL